ncbi:MAG: hypothetical protein WBJ84_03270 [Bacteroidales bacterium]
MIFYQNIALTGLLTPCAEVPEAPEYFTPSGFVCGLEFHRRYNHTIP